MGRILTKDEILQIPSFIYAERIEALVEILKSLFKIDSFAFTRFHIRHGTIFLGNKRDFIAACQTELNKVAAQVMLPHLLGNEIIIYADFTPKTKEEEIYLEKRIKVYNAPLGVGLVEYGKEYVDCYHFATDMVKENMVNHILGQMDTLKQYTRFFLQEMKDVINNQNNYFFSDVRKKLGLTYQNFENFIRHQKRNMYFNASFGALNNQPKVKEFLKMIVLKEKTALTVAEKRCLNSAAKGLSTRKIASIYNVSCRTVEKHLEVVRYKLNANKTSEAVYNARQIGVFCDT